MATKCGRQLKRGTSSSRPSSGACSQGSLGSQASTPHTNNPRTPSPDSETNDESIQRPRPLPVEFSPVKQRQKNQVAKEISDRHDLMVWDLTDEEIIEASFSRYKSPAYKHFNVTLDCILSDDEEPLELVFVFTCKFNPEAHAPHRRACMSANVGTSNLLAGIHKCDARHGVDAQDVTSTRSANMAVPYSPAAHCAAIALRCATSQCPFNIRGTKIPSAEQVSRDTCILYREISGIICTQLTSIMSAIHLVLDGWTAPIVASYLSLVIVWWEQDKIHHMILEFIRLKNKHTGDYLAQVVADCLKHWKLSNKLTTVCMDNASNCNKLVELLPNYIEGFRGEQVRTRCMAHILNLVAKAFMSFFFKSGKKKKATAVIVDDTVIGNDELNPNESEDEEIGDGDDDDDGHALFNKETVASIQDPVIADLAENVQWKIAQNMSVVLELFQNATNLFSQAEEYLENVFNDTDDELSPVIRIAAKAAIEMVDKYISLCDECEVYYISIVMCPGQELDWFKKNEFDKDAISRIKKMAIDAWERDYKLELTPVVTASAVPPQNKYMKKSKPVGKSSTFGLDDIRTYLKEGLVEIEQIANAGGYMKWWENTAATQPNLAWMGRNCRSAPDPKAQTCLDHVCSFLHEYCRLEKRKSQRGNWTKAAQEAAHLCCHAPYYAENLKKWARDFLQDSAELPRINHGGGCQSIIDDDDVTQDIQIYLQSIGKFIKARDIVDYCSTPEMLEQLGRTKSISKSTACRWLIKMGYCWIENPRGQYIDGHEWSDVVQYRQGIFVPRMKYYMGYMQRWVDGVGWALPDGIEWPTVVWYHDESTFYAPDWRQNYWMPPGSSPTPYTKGEGQSLMVADFISADYGWLASLDGMQTARKLF
ncbi:hypothetical protein NP233_g11011 [Leucocoprinus birnbaumii]|uniref:Uncharacterized protein n=1 Tax=Leucocoprinus birnbaumii TaxID=56174 RepID=A0AAD5VN82_9AGAR|nr:hypothetical protein NP233_g11011 [Leucocoprinus birnbaumii]